MHHNSNYIQHQTTRHFSKANFVLDSQKQHDTTSVHGTVKIPGIYNVTVTFHRPNQEFPTIAIKEFHVAPVNSWYNNQM